MNLTDDQKIAYLANLVAVSRADGGISPNETQAIETAMKGISGKKAILKKAELLAQSEGFIPTAVGSFSVRIANLEDMILVSLADGVFDQAEKPVVLAFAKQVGITNDQLQLVLGEVRASLSSVKYRRACPSCSAFVSSDAKFCPECGGSLGVSDKEAAVAVEYAIPPVGIAIEFAESTASGFADAVQKAKVAPENADCIKGQKTWYMAAWPLARIAEAEKLVADLKGMRNRKVWLDGKESRWEDIFGYTWCSEQRNTAYRPLEYCFGVSEKRFNIWGCKQAQMDWVRWSDWFSYGKFKKGGFLKGEHTFVFDKKRIRHELETNLYRFRLCPHLNFKLVEAVLAQLPDEVDVKPKGDWLYKEDYNESPGSIKIREKIENGEYSYTKEFHSSGIVPRTPNTGLQILKRAIQAVGVEAAGVKPILSYRGE